MVWQNSIFIKWPTNQITIKNLAGASLLNESSCLAPALGVTKFIIVTSMILVAIWFAT